MLKCQFISFLLFDHLEHFDIIGFCFGKIFLDLLKLSEDLSLFVSDVFLYYAVTWLGNFYLYADFKCLIAIKLQKYLIFNKPYSMIVFLSIKNILFVIWVFLNSVFLRFLLKAVYCKVLQLGHFVWKQLHNLSLHIPICLNLNAFFIKVGPYMTVRLALLFIKRSEWLWYFYF